MANKQAPKPKGRTIPLKVYLPVGIVEEIRERAELKRRKITAQVEAMLARIIETGEDA